MLFIKKICPKCPPFKKACPKDTRPKRQCLKHPPIISHKPVLAKLGSCLCNSGKYTEKKCSVCIMYSYIFIYWILHRYMALSAELISHNIYGCFMNTKYLRTSKHMVQI